MKYKCESCETQVNLNDKFCGACGSMFDSKSGDSKPLLSLAIVTKFLDNFKNTGETKKAFKQIKGASPKEFKVGDEAYDEYYRVYYGKISKRDVAGLLNLDKDALLVPGLYEDEVEAKKELMKGKHWVFEWKGGGPSQMYYGRDLSYLTNIP